jgi:hypothetical protein
VSEHDDQAAAADASPLEMTALPAPDDEAELGKLHDAQASTVRGLEEREAASRTAMATLDAERTAELAEGRADVGLRERYKNASEDAADWSTAAGLARGKLAAIGEQIAAVQQRIMIAALGVELAEAIKDRDAVLAKTGDRQRQAVTAVKAAAEEFCQVLADERAAVAKVEQLAMQIALGGPMPAVPPAVSTALQTPPDVNPPLPFMQAMWASGQGEVKRVAVLLGEVFGSLPPDPAALAAERDRVLALRAALVQPPAPPQPRRRSWIRGSVRRMASTSTGTRCRRLPRPSWSAAAARHRPAGSGGSVASRSPAEVVTSRSQRGALGPGC